MLLFPDKFHAIYHADISSCFHTHFHTQVYATSGDASLNNWYVVDLRESTSAPIYLIICDRIRDKIFLIIHPAIWLRFIRNVKIVVTHTFFIKTSTK
jgi:hypothetical protein